MGLDTGMFLGPATVVRRVLVEALAVLLASNRLGLMLTNLCLLNQVSYLYSGITSESRNCERGGIKNAFSI